MRSPLREYRQERAAKSKKDSAHRQTGVNPHPLQSWILQLQKSVGNRTVRGMLQAKLAVSQPGDKWEREADRIADAVMGMRKPPATGQRCSDNCAPQQNTNSAALLSSVNQRGLAGPPTPTEIPETVSEALRVPGQPLEHGIRNYMQARFGVDFAGVRIHKDATSTEATKSASADAYAIGSHIFFAADKYVPQSQSGKRLLAHELAHVLQQNRHNAFSGKTVARQETHSDTLGLYSRGRNASPVQIGSASSIRMALNKSSGRSSSPLRPVREQQIKKEIIKLLIDWRVKNPVLEEPWSPYKEANRTFAIVAIQHKNGKVDYFPGKFDTGDILHAEEKAWKEAAPHLTRGCRVYMGVDQVLCGKDKRNCKVEIPKKLRHRFIVEAKVYTLRLKADPKSSPKIALKKWKTRDDLTLKLEFRKPPRINRATMGMKKLLTTTAFVATGVAATPRSNAETFERPVKVKIAQVEKSAPNRPRNVTIKSRRVVRIATVESGLERMRLAAPRKQTMRGKQISPVKAFSARNIGFLLIGFGATLSNILSRKAQEEATAELRRNENDIRSRMEKYPDQGVLLILEFEETHSAFHPAINIATEPMVGTLWRGLAWKSGRTLADALYRYGVQGTASKGQIKREYLWMPPVGQRVTEKTNLDSSMVRSRIERLVGRIQRLEAKARQLRQSGSKTSCSNWYLPEGDRLHLPGNDVLTHPARADAKAAENYLGEEDLSSAMISIKTGEARILNTFDILFSYERGLCSICEQLLDDLFLSQQTKSGRAIGKAHVPTTNLAHEPIQNVQIRIRPHDEYYPRNGS